MPRMIDQKILLVEDSKTVALAIKDRLEADLDLAVDIVGSLEQAREIIAKNSSGYFLAILDLGLPDTLSNEIVDLSIDNGIPSVVFTSQFDLTTRDALIEKGVIDYFIKGKHSVAQLSEFIRRLSSNVSTKVLVVDDSATSRALLRNMLEKFMFQVLEAENGETALELLSRNRDLKIVVTDYAMPGMNGYDLTTAIRKEFSQEDLAIIGLSAIGDKYLPAGFIKNGANDFLQKPFETEEFHCRVIHNLETLERIQKLRELSTLKDRFLGMAAHDLRNPINGITSFTQLMLSGHCGEFTSEQKEIIGLLHRASTEMHQLVKDLLDVAAIESGKVDLKLKPNNITALIRERVHISKLLADKKGISIDLDLEKTPLFIFDKGRIGQVLDNLLSNAIKFSPPDTTISIRMTGTDSQVEIGVQDQGPGIPEEEMNLLFSPFQKLSVKPTAGETSTGLGLAIVKKIVSAHNGNIWVESDPGKGANFIFSLPVRKLSA